MMIRNAQRGVRLQATIERLELAAGRIASCADWPQVQDSPHPSH